MWKQNTSCLSHEKKLMWEINEVGEREERVGTYRSLRGLAVDKARLIVLGLLLLLVAVVILHDVYCIVRYVVGCGS